MANEKLILELELNMKKFSEAFDKLATDVGRRLTAIEKRTGKLIKKMRKARG